MSVILDKQSGEFLDITISSFNNSFGRERINYSMKYGIYTPIEKYIEELEGILMGPHDDKTAKRKQRKVFLEKCQRDPLLKRFFQLLLCWLNGGGDREYKIGEYNFSDYNKQNVILIVSGGNIITIFAKLLKNIVDKAVEVSSEAYQAGQLQLQLQLLQKRLETLLQYLQTLFNDLQQVQTLGQQVQELMQKVQTLGHEVQTLEQQGQLTLPKLKQQIDKFYQDAEALYLNTRSLYKEAGVSTHEMDTRFLQLADILENIKINLTLSLSEQLLNAAHGVDGVMTHAEAFFNKLTITNRNIIENIATGEGKNKYSILSHLLGLLLTDGVHSATGIDQNSLLYQITELSQKDYSDFDYGIVPNKPPDMDPNPITAYKEMETHFPIPSPLPQGFTLFRVKSLVQCQGGPQFKQSELTKQEFACKALGFNPEKLTPQSTNQSDAQELESKLKVASGNPKNQIDKKYVSNIKNCLKYIKNFLLPKKQIILDSTKFNIKTIKDYLSQLLHSAIGRGVPFPYAATDDFELEAIIYYINYNTFLLNLSIQKWGEPWKVGNKWFEGLNEAERQEIEVTNQEREAGRRAGLSERELPPPRGLHQSSVSKWATEEYSKYAYPNGYINVLNSFGSLSSIINSKYLLDLTGYLIKMFLNFPHPTELLSGEQLSKSLSEILLDQIRTKLSESKTCVNAIMLPSKLTYINTTLFNIPDLSQIVKDSVIKPLQAERYSELGFPDGINIVVNTIIPDDSKAQSEMLFADAAAPDPIEKEESFIDIDLLLSKAEHISLPTQLHDQLSGQFQELKVQLQKEQKFENDLDKLLLWKQAAESAQLHTLASQFQAIINEFQVAIANFQTLFKGSFMLFNYLQSWVATDEQVNFVFKFFDQVHKFWLETQNLEQQFAQAEEAARLYLGSYNHDLAKITVNKLNGAYTELNSWAKKAGQSGNLSLVQKFDELANKFKQGENEYIKLRDDLATPNKYESDENLRERAQTMLSPNNQEMKKLWGWFGDKEQVAVAHSLVGGKRKGLIKKSKSQKGKRKTRKCKKSKKYKKSGKKTTRKFRQFRKCKKTRKHRHQIKVQKKTKKLIK